MKTRQTRKITRDDLLSMILNKAGIPVDSNNRNGYMSTDQLHSLLVYIESRENRLNSQKRMIDKLTERVKTSNGSEAP